MWFRDAAPLTYDSGDYPELLRRALELPTTPRRAREARLRARRAAIAASASPSASRASASGPSRAPSAARRPRACRRDQRRAAAGPGLPDRLRPDRGRRGRRPLRGRRRRDGRHGRHPLRRRQLRQPRHRQCRARGPAGRRRAARQDPRGRRATCWRPRPEDLDIVDGAVQVRGVPDRGVPLAQVARLGNGAGVRHGHAGRLLGRARGLRLLHAGRPGIQAAATCAFWTSTPRPAR